MASADLILHVYSPQSHRVHRGFICFTHRPLPMGKTQTALKGNYSIIRTVYLHPMIMMEYVCAREKRCTLIPDL